MNRFFQHSLFASGLTIPRMTEWPNSCPFMLQLFAVWFLPRDAMQARSLLSCSVRLSVCLSVTFVDHVKTNKDIFEIFLPSGSDTILVFLSQRWCRYSDGNPSNGGVECKGDDKMTTFSQISRCISETVIVRWAHAARQFVSIEFSFHPYNV